MNVISWLGVVGAVISILAFLFAVWVRIKSDARVREFESIIQSVYDVTGNILWDMHALSAEDPATRLRNAEKSLGGVTALRVIAGKYAKTAINFRETEIGALLERGIIWGRDMIYELEMSTPIQEIWLLTPDLEPDLSDSTTGKSVATNLKARKKYVYFCPSDMPDLESEKRRLLANIGALKPQDAGRVTVVPIGPDILRHVLQRGNTILFFTDDPEWGTYNAFEEVVFTKVSERGIFWQEHKPSVAAEIRAILRQALQDWRASSSA